MAGETEFLEVNYSSSDDESCTGNIIRELGRPKLPVQKLDITKHPPLPLTIFKGVGLRSECVKTINGEKIPSIANNLSPEKRARDSLQDILYTRRLAKWFVARNYKEAVSRYPKAQFQLGTLGYEEQCTISDTLIYKSSTFDFAKKSSGSSDQGSFSATPDLSTNGVIGANQIQQSALTFDSNFESGNLFKAVIVTGREKLMTPNTINYLQSSPGSFSVPENVDQEYDLTLSNDINTSGNIQWYYFSASSEDIVQGSNASRKSLYPLRVRFNIINMQKNDALYNFGMKPATFVSTNIQDDWSHSGEDICYYKHWTQPSEDISNNEDKKKKNERLYVLTFTYTFLNPCKVYFAHSFPYTYSDLKKYLGLLEENPRISSIMDRKELCTSIAGNVCECITITNKVNEISCPGPLKPAIIISSRIHPGESNSSYMMNGVIDFLVSENFEAKILRDNFVFKLIPMLNPDGVVHGNYRCSLIGTDLNRRYLNAHPSLYPTVSAMKNLLSDSQKKRGVLLFLDLHGHSKKKNSFLYGCDCTLQSNKLNSVAMNTYTNDEIDMNKIYARTFAKVLCTLSDVKKGGYFSYRDSSFNVKNSKRSTGRVVSWRDLQIPGTFTIESSFCGSGNNDEKKILKHYEDPNQFSDLPIQNDVNDLNDTYSLNDNFKFLSPKKRLIDCKNVRNQSINEHNDQSLFRSFSTYEIHQNEVHLSSLEKINDDNQSSLPLLNEVNLLSPSYNGFRKRSNSLSLQSLTPTLAASARKRSNDKNGSLRNRKRSSTFRDTGNPLFEKLMKSYEIATHYTKQDFKNIGRDIIRGIFCFSNLNAGNAVPSDRSKNLSPTKLKRKQSLYRSSSIQHNITNSIENNVRADLESNHREESGKEKNPFMKFLVEHERKGNDFNSSSYLIEGLNTDRQRGGNIGQGNAEGNGGADLNNGFKNGFLFPVSVDSCMLFQPLKRPSVYTVDAIHDAQSDYSSIMQNPKDYTFLRMKCEILIRQSLKIGCPKVFGIDDNFIDEIDDREQCECDDGSDSEPSVDNIPTLKLLGKKNMSTFKDSKSLMRALQKAAKKRSKASDKTAHKMSKKLAKELSEVSKSLMIRETIPAPGPGSGLVHGSRSAMGAAIQEKVQKTSGMEDVSTGIKIAAEHGFKRNEISERFLKLSLESSNITPEQSHARSFNVLKQESDSHGTASARSILSGRLPRMSVQRSHETKTSDQIDNNNNIDSNNIDNNSYINNNNIKNNNINNNNINVKALIRPKSETRIIKNNLLTLILPSGHSAGTGHERDNVGHIGYNIRESPRGKRKSSHLKAFGPADSFIRHFPISQDSSEKSSATLTNKNILKNGFSTSLYRL